VRFAIVRALFNAEITSGLLKGALRAFEDARVSKRNIAVYEVPGSFELPVAALWLAKTGRYDAVVCLGCVIRGETAHFEYVAGEAARGIAAVALQTGVPIIFGVLTTESVAQARARSADDVAADLQVGSSSHHTSSQKPGNKGYEAAQSALDMATLRRKMHKG
jgi:6,7-dimethyl-8-ribityllumazine synthase